MSDSADQLTECFRAVFPDVDPAQLPQLSRDGEVWDSLATVSLITVVEEEFDVEFDDDTVDGLTSYAAFRDALAAAGR